MKKNIYLCTLLLVFLLLASGRANAYNITGHSYYDYCYCANFTINTNVPPAPAFTYTVELSYGDGTTDTTYCDSISSASRCHSYASTGTYTIKAVLLSSTGSRLDSITFTQSVTGCTWMYGYIYHDINTDCSLDAGDGYFYGSTSIEVDSASIPIDTIIGYSFFEYRALGIGKSYTFKMLTSAVGGLIAACPSSGSITATSSPSYTHVGDFGFQCSSSTAFDVAIHPWLEAISTEYYAGAYITNNSCNSKSGNFSISVDPRYNIKYIWPAGASVSGSTITWSYTGLTVDEPKWFYVFADTDSAHAATIGSTITSSMNLTPTSGDADTTNNHWTCTDTVRSSWDPNEKDVMPRGNIQSGTRLTYTLKFENTGNAPAKNIHILDTLSANLDANSIQIVTSTSPMTFSKLKAGSATVLKFDFANINLPDSSHHGQADGFVMFSINTRSGLATGTKIDNRAGIYFDDNKVVMTNMVENTIHPLAIPVLNNSNPVVIYPNPVNNILTIKTAAGAFDQLTVINSVGQVLTQQSVQSSEMHVDMHSFAPGMYFIMLKGASGSQVQKVEKL